MSYEETCDDNKLCYEAMELLIRLIAINKILNVNTYILEEQLSAVKLRIRENLKAIV